MRIMALEARQQGRQTENGQHWDADCVESLGKVANTFREKGDLAGVHLCAAVDEEMKARNEDGRCRAVGRLLLLLAMARAAGGADHEAAHIVLPKLQDLFNEAQHQAKLERLKAEVENA